MIHRSRATGGGDAGSDQTAGALFSDVDLEVCIPARHPLRNVRETGNDPLASMDAEFDRFFAKDSRPSIAPERLLQASLVQMFFSLRSER